MDDIYKTINEIREQIEKLFASIDRTEDHLHEYARLWRNWNAKKEEKCTENQ